MAEENNISLDELRQLSMQCLRVNGCDTPNAAAVTETVVAAEGDRCPSHGALRLPGYVRSLRLSAANGEANPTLSRLAPAVLQIEGDNGFTPLALQRGFEPLAETARENGLAALSIVNTHHFAALWPEVEALTNRGLSAFAFTASLPIVPPPGGTTPLFGTNPMAFGWPRHEAPPVIFDQASAAMAQGEVIIAAREGRVLPPGVGLDEAGRPTRDPAAALDGGILPFGGYKGALIAMLVELLSCALLGQEFGCEANKPPGPQKTTHPGGELLIALDPARFGDPDGWARHAEVLFSAMTAQEGVRLPGARRYHARRETAATGVRVPDELLTEIRELAHGY